MKHKSLVLIVCLVLAVFGFNAATAESLETVTTVSLETGSLLADYAEIGQILDIAAIRIHSLPDGYGAFVLSLSGTDALKSLFKAEETGVYVQSNALGQQPLYFSWEDLKDIMMEQMEEYADMEGMEMPFDMGMMQSMMDGSITEEQMREMMDLDDEILAYITEMYEKQTVEKGTFALEGSDVANTKTQTVIDKYDLSRALELPSVKEQISEQITLMYPELPEDEIDQQVVEQLADLKQSIIDIDAALTTTVYTTDDEFVAMKAEFSASTDDYNGDSIPITVSITVTKSTIETAAFYQLSVLLAQGDEEFLNQYGSLYVSDEFVSGQYTFYAMPDEPMIAITLNCDRSLPGQTDGELAFTLYDGGEQTVYVMFEQQKADNETDTMIDIYIGGSVDGIKNALDESSLISIDVNTVVQPDSGFFAVLQSATPETAIQLLQMDDDKLEAYMQGMEQGLLMTLLTVIDSLPPDISESLMQGMGGF